MSVYMRWMFALLLIANIAFFTPKTTNRATRLFWFAHNLERAADRATNICERVLYTVTGKMDEIGASKY